MLKPIMDKLFVKKRNKEMMVMKMNDGKGKPNPKGKIYKRKSEALSEFNLKNQEQPVPQPKDYEEIEY